LKKEGYASSSVRKAMRLVSHVSRWMMATGLKLHELT
jgi:hypothetical protein